MRGLAIFLSVLMAACVSEQEPSAASEPTVSAAAASPTPSPSEATPESLQYKFKMGETARTPIGNRVTVYSWNTDTARPIEADAGYQFSQIEARYCLNKNLPGFRASELIYSLTLEMPNGLRVSADNTGYRGDEFISMNFRLSPGACIRGSSSFNHRKVRGPKQWCWEQQRHRRTFAGSFVDNHATGVEIAPLRAGLVTVEAFSVRGEGRSLLAIRGVLGIGGVSGILAAARVA